MNEESIPRRIQAEKRVPAETAITNAMNAVEDMPADVRLTDAVNLLAAARDLVADFVDGIDSPRRLDPHYVQTLEEENDALRRDLNRAQKGLESWFRE